MKTCSSRPVITATKRHTRDFCRKPGAGAPEVSQMPCRQRCEGFCYQHMNAGKVGWDQRATRAPAHHRERCHRWAGAAYQPLVPPYGAENLKYTEKILHSVALRADTASAMVLHIPARQTDSVASDLLSPQFSGCIVCYKLRRRIFHEFSGLDQFCRLCKPPFSTSDLQDRHDRL